MRFATLTAASFSLLMLASCGPQPLTLKSEDGSKQLTLQVEIADTPEARNQGLMNRTEMAADHGMLFVFPEPQMLVFWMKDTKIPLDIAFFDKDGKFIGGMEMQPCVQEPCPRYSAPAMGSYALEMVKGTRVKHGIGMGWSLDVNAVKAMSNPK